MSFKPGDWTCPKPSCKNHNFARRDTCKMCGTGKGGVAAAGTVTGNADWKCTNCDFLIYGHKDKCKKCGQCRPGGPVRAEAVAESELPDAKRRAVPSVSNVSSVSIVLAPGHNNPIGECIVVFAWDFEGAGKHLDTPVIAFGCCIALLDTNGKFTVHKKSFVPGYNSDRVHFERQCWDEFWVKNQHVLEKIKTSATPFEFRMSVAAEYRLAMEAAMELADVMNAKLHVVSDNPVYDGGQLCTILQECDENPIYYSPDGKKYRVIENSSSFVRGLVLGLGLSSTWPGSGAFKLLKEAYELPPEPTTTFHMPDDDAEHIAWEFASAYGVSIGMFPKK